jgi:hypothetical protein
MPMPPPTVSAAALATHQAAPGSIAQESPRGGAAGYFNITTMVSYAVWPAFENWCGTFFGT